MTQGCHRPGLPWGLDLCNEENMTASFSDPSRRPARPTLLCRCVQAGVVVCGLAGGLVEFLALQRRIVDTSLT